MEVLEWLSNNWTTIALFATGIVNVYAFSKKEIREYLLSGFRKQKEKSEVEKSQLEVQDAKVDALAKYKQFMDEQMLDMMNKYNNLKSQVEIDHKKLTEQIEQDREIMQRMKEWIMRATRYFKQHNIKFEEYTDA